MELDKLSEHDHLEEILPVEGWLGEYIQFAKDLEACPRFKFFTACCCLGAAVNNKVWIQRGDAGLLPKLFPNIWVILLAPPGRGHKTSTINMGINCLIEACPEVRILADKLTPEALVQALSEPVGPRERIRIGPRDATGLIKAPELSVFFGRQQYNTGLVALITDLYDYREEWSVETIGRGKNVLKRNCISILGGSTPTWLQKMLPDDAFTGGFMRRFLLVEMPPNYFKRRAYPKNLKESTGWSDIVQGLRTLSIIQGEMGWTPTCAEYYKEYYENLKPTGDEQKDAYLEGEAEQILRISMLLALSKGELFISLEDFKLAKQIVEVLMEETNPRIERLSTHPRMSVAQDVLSLLRQLGPTPESILLKRVYRTLSLGDSQFYEAVRVLLKTRDIEIIGKPPNTTYRLRKETEK